MRYPAPALSDLPRVLLCSFDVIPGPTGLSRRLTEYLRELSEHFSVVVLSAKTPDHSHIQRYQGARLLRVPVGGGDLPSRVQAFDRAVRRQLESEEYALAHFTDPFGGYAICELRETFGYRLIYEAHGFPSQELASQDPQLEGDRRFLAKVRRQELFCLMNADRVITGSETTRHFIQGLGVSEELVDVLRAPVDLGAMAAETTREPTGSPMRVLYLGSQVDWQGLPALLRATKQALQQVDLQLTLVGPPHVREQPLLEDLIRELGIERKVSFQPSIPHENLPEVLSAADVGVVPLADADRNRNQGGPLSKVAEYLAAGRPILASDLPLTREAVPSEAGLFHAPGDVEALAANLVRLAKSAELRVRMGSAARDAARAAHDAEPLRRKLAGVYAKLANVHIPGLTDRAAEPFTSTLRSGQEKSTLSDAVGTDPAIVPRTLRVDVPAAAQPDIAPVAEHATQATDPEAQLVGSTGWSGVPKGADDVVRVVALSPLLPLPDSEPEGIGPEEPRGQTIEAVPSFLTANRSDHLIGERLRDREESSTPIVRAPVAPEPAAAPAQRPAPTFTPRRFPPGRPPTVIPTAPPVPARTAPQVFTPTAPPAAPPGAAVFTSPISPVSSPAPTPIAAPPSASVPAGAVPPSQGAASATPSATPPPLRPTVTPPALPAMRSSPRGELAQPPTASADGAPRASSSTLTVQPPSLNLAPPPLPPPVGRVTSPARPDDAEPVEVAADEVESADDEAEGLVEISAVVLLETIDPEGRLSSDEAAPAAEPALEVADDAVLDPIDEPVLAPPDVPSGETIPSNLDPWFAQLVHGYCPPEGAQFARPTPPTNFPGREGPPPATVQPAAPAPQSFPTRCGGG